MPRRSSTRRARVEVAAALARTTATVHAMHAALAQLTAEATAERAHLAHDATARLYYDGYLMALRHVRRSAFPADPEDPTDAVAPTVEREPPRCPT